MRQTGIVFESCSVKHFYIIFKFLRTGINFELKFFIANSANIRWKNLTFGDVWSTLQVHYSAISLQRLVF